MSRPPRPSGSARPRAAIVAIAALALAALMSAGCGQRREVNTTAFALALAVDRAGPEEVDVTVQLAVPAKLQEGGAGGGGPPVWNLGGRGKSIFDAIRAMTSRSGRPIFWGHLQVVAFGEELARAGLRPHLDFFSRNREVRRTVWVAIAEGRAAQILDAKPQIEPIPALFARRLMENRGLHGHAPGVTLNEFLVALAEPGLEPWAPRARLAGGTEGKAADQIELAGAAAFRGDRMAGWLDPAQARGVLWVRNELRGGTLTVTGDGRDALPVFAGGDARPAFALHGRPHATLEIIRASSRQQVEWRGGRPFARLSLRLESNLVEDEGVAAPESARLGEAGLADLERRAEQAAREDVRRAFERAKQLGSDVFGVGAALYRRNPDRFPAERWEEAFRQTEFEVEVQAQVARTGLTGAGPAPR